MGLAGCSRKAVRRKAARNKSTFFFFTAGDGRKRRLFFKSWCLIGLDRKSKSNFQILQRILAAPILLALMMNYDNFGDTSIS